MNDYEETDLEVNPEPMPEPEEEAEVVQDEEEEFFPEDDDDFELPDPNAAITIKTSGGDTRYIPAPEPLTVAAAMLTSGLRPNGVVSFYLNGAEVKEDTVLPGGSTLTVIGSVKGG